MKYRPFGKTGSKVSEIGMGCWAIGGNAYGNSYGPTSDEESIKAIKKAAELGCNFFDTADVYGHGRSEELLGAALAGIRKNVFIATKAGGSYMYDENFGHVNFSGEYMNFAVEQSLRRLRTDYIDVYQLHNPPLHLIREGEVFRPLRDLQKKGKVRNVGVSVFTLEEGDAALDHVDCIQCVFNMLDPRKFELMEEAKRRGVAVIVREPLANGFLTGKYGANSRFDETDIRYRFPPDYIGQMVETVDEIRKGLSNRNATMAQLALKYVLAFDSVSTVIPGAKTPQQAEENMLASDMPDMTDEEMSVLGS